MNVGKLQHFKIFVGCKGVITVLVKLGNKLLRVFNGLNGIGNKVLFALVYNRVNNGGSRGNNNY